MTEYARYEEQTFEPEKISEGTTTGSSFVWLLVGIGIGAGAALLLTPSTGRELRSALAHGYRRTIDGVSRGTQQLRRHGSNLISFTRRSGSSRTQQG
ncbi:MAG: YtxH domain-containing protein [Candidatus Angelobacter sp.]